MTVCRDVFKSYKFHKLMNATLTDDEDDEPMKLRRRKKHEMEPEIELDEDAVVRTPPLFYSS